MIYQCTTQVPNALFDIHLPRLTESELRITLVIIRQTFGWIDKTTGKRKTRDRISHSQFIAKTGLSRRVVSSAIMSLVNKGLIAITSIDGSCMNNPNERQGKSIIYYAVTSQLVQPTTSTCATTAQQLVQISAYNKTNYTKINNTKLTRQSVRCSKMEHISSLLSQKEKQLRQVIIK